MPKPRVLICYDYFDPAYLAGGPIRSLYNLTAALSEKIDFYIITSNEDLGAVNIDVAPDQWVDHKTRASVYYISPAHRNYKNIKKLIYEVKPTILYVNGLYSTSFSIYPLLVARNSLNKYKVIIAPRGMLMSNALRQKPLKKSVFLFMYKWLLKNRWQWHATSEPEQEAIRTYHDKMTISLATNIPTKVSEAHQRAQAIYKTSRAADQPLRLITVALISPMKNHLLVIQALKAIETEVVWDIFGPVKDPSYWQECLAEMQYLPANITVNYDGEIAPAQVHKKMVGYDIYIQPSESENFGHSIHDALEIGHWVITSKNVPFQNLIDKGIGENVLTTSKDIRSSILSYKKSDHTNRPAKALVLNYSVKSHEILLSQSPPKNISTEPQKGKDK